MSNRRSSWCAGSVGEGRVSFGADYDLAWRFFGRHFFPAKRGDRWRRISQFAVLDQLFDLLTVQSFVLEQRLRDRGEVIAIRNQRLFGRLISVVEQAADFAIDLFGGRFAVIAVAGQFAAEEN